MSLAFLRRWTETDRRCLGLLLAISVLVWTPRLRGPIDLRWDAGVYYTLGSSLATGRGYRLLYEPGAIQAIQYPPVMAAIAAAHQKLAGTSDPATVAVWLRWSFALLSLGYVAAVFALARQLLTPRRALLVALLTALHPQTLFFSDLFMSEIPFATVTVLFLLAVIGGRQLTGRPRSILSVCAGILALTAFGLRTAGLALLAAWAAESLVRRQWSAVALRVACALVAVGSWQAYTRQVQNGLAYERPAYAYQRAGYQFYNVGYSENSAYIDPFKPELGRAGPVQVLGRLAANVGHVPAAIGEAVSVPKSWWWGEIEKVNEHLPGIQLPRWLASVAVVGLSLVVLAGLVLLARAGHVLPGFYVAASVVLICMTPWSGQFSRYLVPLTPVLALALVQSYAAASDRARAAPSRSWPRLRLGLTVAIALAVAQQVVTTGVLFTTHHQAARYVDRAGTTRPYALFYYDEAWRTHDDALAWLATQGRADDIVASSAPPLVYLRTGHASVMPPYEVSAPTAERLLESVPVTYLVVDNLDSPDVSRRYLGPVVNAYPDRWRLVYDRGGPRIYRSASNAESLAGSK